MPLTFPSPAYLNILKSISLILLSIIFIPFFTLIAVLGFIISPFTKTSNHIKHHRQWRKSSSSTFRPRTVLITGIGTSKGLMLARSFYRAGHRVIGSDFEPYYVPVSGHFSKSIKSFYSLSTPARGTGAAVYIQDLLTIIAKERVGLWIGCSDVVSTVEDAEAAEVIEKETKCKAVQFSASLTETLQDEQTFIKHTRELRLNVPSSNVITSKTEALSVLYPSSPNISETQPQLQLPDHQYTTRPINPDTAPHSNNTFLPLPSFKETQLYLDNLNLSPFRPSTLQQYIPGRDYRTHSLILQGKLRAFIASPSLSSSQPVNHIPLYATSALSLAMRSYTEEYARKTDSTMTGHLSLIFRIPEAIASKEEYHFGASSQEIQHLMMTQIYTTSCSPRIDTSTVVLSDSGEDLAETYLSLLPDHEPQGIANGHRDPQQIIVPSPATEGYYSLGYDVVRLLLVPGLKMLKREMSIREMVQTWAACAGYVLFWREELWEAWDPWPWWWTYVVYWPLMLSIRLWEGRAWDVSTGEMSRC